MESDAVDPTAVEADTEIMAAIEEGSIDRLVIADISTDDAYITAPLGTAASLPAWR
jgi:hypothetical protein